MNFKIYIIGDKLQNFYSDAIKEYEKRLSRYCKISLVSVKNQTMLAKKLSNKSYIIVISTNGNSISSEEFADKISNFAISGISDISIIIGGQNTNCNETIAISPMEMNLSLKTTIILEQIYRAYRIINNQAYHK